MADKKEPVPSSDQPEVAPPEAKEEASADQTESKDSTDSKLPEQGVSDRTREQFEKLTETNQRLAQQLREYESRKSSESFQEEIPKLYDEKTGIVDIKALEDLQKRVYEADKQVKQVEQRVTQSATDLQSRELYSAHPELKNPKTDEAKELFDESERIWMHSQAYPEKYDGQPLTQKEAADRAKQRLEKPDTSQQQEESKQQASLGADGQSSQRVQSTIVSEELNRLRQGTREGNTESMVARMRAIRESASK